MSSTRVNHTGQSLLPILTLAAICCFPLAPESLAIGQAPFVETVKSTGSFTIVQDQRAAPLLVDANDFPGVVRAVNDLQKDVARVTGVTPAIGTGAEAIIIGTVGKSAIIDKMISDKTIDVKDIAGKWESYFLQVVANPMPGVASALVIAGSDKRGAIYGIYDLSEQIGVSPWYYWADVPAQHHDALFVKAGRYAQGSPSVKYRGIFLNDESPDLTEWIREKYGTVPTGAGQTTANYGRQFYTNLFELILRIKGNYLWPAMWNNRFSMDDPQNAPLADMYGVVIGTSHQDPMLRSEKEWTWGPGRTVGDRNYATHPSELVAFWREGLTMNKGYESILTLGLRGAGDRPMIANATDGQSMDLLGKIIADQRKLIADVVNADVTQVPQMWCPYKEVQTYYDKGFRVPDDVTILWAEDNNGNLRRVPTAEERKRTGGSGIYYHFDYVGSPRNYKWINSSPIAKVYDQMSWAKHNGADRIWIVNVGHFKGYELPMQFFMDLAWNSGQWTADKMNEYTRLWSQQQFGPQSASDIADLVEKYTKFNGRRKPEQLEPGTYSLVNYHEADSVAAGYKAIADKADEIDAKLPAAVRPSFYELVKFPVQICANLNELYYAAAQNALYASQGRASAGDKAAEVRALFAKDGEMTTYYNKTFLDGKWDHFMDQTHIGYTSWQDPGQNNLNTIGLAETRAQAAAAVANAPAGPARRGGGGGGFGAPGGRGGRGGGGNRVLEDPPEASVMGVAVEGNEAAFSGGEASAPALPAFDAFNQQRRYVDVFDKGRTAFSFSATASAPWIVLSQAAGRVDKDQRLWVSVDWTKAPADAARGVVTITGATNTVTVAVSELNPTQITRTTLSGFVEAEGVVAIEPEHFTKKNDVGANHWEKLEDYGRTLSGMRAMSPVDVSATPQKDAPSLEYRMYLFTAAAPNVAIETSPMLNSTPGRGVRLAVSLDEAAPQLLTVVPQGYAASGNDWETSVKNNARFVSARLPLVTPGYHTLKVWMVDPGVVVQKLVVDMGGLKASYLGPPESYFNNAASMSKN